MLEAGTTAGGKLRGVAVGDLVLPAGADSFLARKPWAVQLCRELGIELETPGASGAFLWTDAGLVPLIKDAPFGIPGDVGDLFRWPGLSAAGKRRAAQDLIRRARKADDDESLGSLLRRRFGDEATELALAPLLAGLYAGDVDRLSVRATFPDLATWERAQGSLFRGSQATSKLARKSQLGPMFVRPRGGVDRLTDELASPRGRPGAPRRRGHRRGARPRLARGRRHRRCGRRRAGDARARGGPDARRRRRPRRRPSLAGIRSRIDRGRAHGLRGGHARRASRRHRLRRAPRPGADDRGDLAQRQVAERGVRHPGGRALLRGGRRRGRRARRAPTPTSSTRAPGTSRPSCGSPTSPITRPSCAGRRRCRSTRSGISSGWRGSGRRCRPVSSSWARATTAWACPIASARRTRRPSGSSRASRPITRRRFHDRSANDHLRAVPGVQGDRSVPRRARRGRRPARRRAGDREPRQGVGGPGRGARHVLDGGVPRRRRPDALARRTLARRRAAVPGRVPAHASRAAAGSRPGRSWAS